MSLPDFDAQSGDIPISNPARASRRYYWPAGTNGAERAAARGRFAGHARARETLAAHGRHISKEEDSLSADYDFDLGTSSFRVSTQSAEAQTWFDRGLVWCYAFAHEESVHCFRRAARHDPDCAMAWWGIGYASGPYYNKQWSKFDPVDLERTLHTVRDAARQALDRIEGAAPIERALVEALARRYPSSKPGDFDRWNDDYAGAMRDVHRSFSDDPDVCALFAEALLNRTPWALWDLETGEPAAGADTLEVIDVLERSIGALEAAGEADHPGLLHMFIHALEMCPNPERALRAADRLRELVPDAGHLRHMPTHIDIQCGYYQATVDWNATAVAVDRKLFESDEDPGAWHTLSFAHNYHFMLYGAMFLGQYRAAMEATAGIVEAIPESALRVESPPMADWLEGFVAMQVHAPIRFGRWRDIIAMALPEDRELYCATTAMLHYAKGLAHAVLEDVPAARQEQARFQAATARVPASRTVFNNKCVDILAIAAEMLQGEVSYRTGDYETAFEHLRAAIRLSEDLPYDEPWGWMQPPRHALGALLLEQGRVEEAEAVYRADLGLDDDVPRACRHPENVWSLHGFHECLVRLGKRTEARLVAPRLALALARTDVPIESSCLCRRHCVSCPPSG